MIGITKNYQDVKIYGFAIVSGALHQHTSLTFKKKYINLLFLSLY